MSSLAEALPIEQQRCRELLKAYHDIGAAGIFGAMSIEAALRRADVAVMSGDVVEILKSYEELKDFK